jgi:hypothetical protein
MQAELDAAIAGRPAEPPKPPPGEERGRAAAGLAQTLLAAVEEYDCYDLIGATDAFPYVRLTPPEDTDGHCARTSRAGRAMNCCDPPKFARLRASAGAVALGLGRIVALCSLAHPLHTRSTNVFGASISEARTRPHPRWRWAQRSSSTAAIRTREPYRRHVLYVRFSRFRRFFSRS